MDGPVTTRAALLQALRQSPGYGLELIRRVESITGGLLRLSEGRVYSILAALAKEGLVRVSRVAPKGRRGARTRIYYDLTSQGVEVSASERAVLSALVAGRTTPHHPVSWYERTAMARRVLEAEDLAESGEQFRSAASAPTRLSGRR
jgi:DNA-binding PadR family transcriptional regulator